MLLSACPQAVAVVLPFPQFWD